MDRPSPRAAYLLAASLPLAWIAVARASGQALTAAQPSRLIARYGAVDGTVFATHEWWRLLTSQWLHSKGPHMLFNALIVAVAGALIEREQGIRRVLGLYLLGGLVGQIAGVIAYPDLVSSGASQAMLALCGAVLASPRVARGRAAIAWGLVALATAVQLALDLKVSGLPKAGHVAGLVVGLAYGRWRPLGASPPAAASARTDVASAPDHEKP